MTHDPARCDHIIAELTRIAPDLDRLPAPYRRRIRIALRVAIAAATIPGGTL